MSAADAGGQAPKRAGLVLGTLILAAAVANMNLTIANVALPDIGAAFEASQLQLNLIAIGYSLGLAASVLWLGAIGDRYGRKIMILIGLSATIPASVLAGFAGSWETLFAARVLGGLAAGLTYPTTLAIITVLWSGRARTKAIALWSAVGGGAAVLGPLLAGALLERFAWGSVFLVTIPLALLGLVLAWCFVPKAGARASGRVDHLGGLITVAMVGALVFALNVVAAPGMLLLAGALFGVAVVLAVVFVLRQRRVANPLYDFRVAARPTFWVAAVGGIIIFGALMGVVFINQQYLQNVLGYSAIAAGAAAIPAVAMMVLLAPLSARLVETRGSRFTLLIGQGLLALAFVAMFFCWGPDSPYAVVLIPLVLLGAGVGFAQTPSARALTGSVPRTRVGMASGTADLQRDLGGALMTSIFGALLTAGYAAAMGKAIGASGQDVTADTQNQLQMSFAGAASIARSAPEFADQILAAARESFLKGDLLAYGAGLLAVLVGIGLVVAFFPRRSRELELQAEYEREDGGA